MTRWRPRSLTTVCSSLLWAGSAFALFGSHANAHGEEVVTRGSLWNHWTLEPIVLVSLFLVGYLYFRGLIVLWTRAGVNRGVRRWQGVAFAVALLAIVTAIVSPLDEWSKTLFAAHMGQHLVLMLLAAPLFVLGLPATALIWSLPRSWRHHLPALAHRPLIQSLRRWGVNPFVAIALHSAVIWLWHTPLLYEAALRHDAVHALEHFTFFGTAVLFWGIVFQTRGRRSAGPGIAVFALFALALQGSALGALLTFSASPWYEVHETGALAWGLTTLEDQQLAGLIMWIPSGVVYLAAVLAVVGRWLTGMDRASASRAPVRFSGERVGFARRSSRA